MQDQTQEQKAALSLEIDRMIEEELQQTVSYHINKYKKTFERKLGLTEDDLMNEIREQVWKGLITWKSTGGANKKTWINGIIKKRFSTLSRRTTIEKYNAIEYYADVFSSAGGAADKSHLETHETGETLLMRRQEMMQDRAYLDLCERKIFIDLIQGFNLEEMAVRHSMTRQQIVATINKIDEQVKRGRKRNG